MSSKPGSAPDRKPRSMDMAVLEASLRRAAAEFPYPPTPDLAAQVRRRLRPPTGRAPRRSGGRRLALGLVVVLLLAVAAVLAAPVRAQVLEWLRIGAVRIFFTLPSPTPAAPVPTGTPNPTGTPMPTPTFLQSVLDLDGETQLADAQEKAGFPILLPGYPAELGAPQHVFFQQYNRAAVVLVWMDPARPGKVHMSLTETASSSFLYEKYAPKSVLETQVNGDAAVWIDGDYLLVTRSGEYTMTRLINQSHTLIWSNGEMTFRLETDEDLATALKIAESLR